MKNLFVVILPLPLTKNQSSAGDISNVYGPPFFSCFSFSFLLFFYHHQSSDAKKQETSNSNPSIEKAFSSISMASAGIVPAATSADTTSSYSDCALHSAWNGFMEKRFESEVTGEGSRDVDSDAPCPKQFSGVDGMENG